VECRAFTAPSSTHLAQSKLIDLEISCLDNFSYDDFKLFFTSFPNLTNLEVCFKLIPGFDETDFLRFVKYNKPALAKLKSLSILGLKEMTGKSVCALLHNSNLDKFENFSETKFSDTDIKVLKEIAKNRGMAIIHFYRHEKLCFTCKNGNHTIRNFETLSD